jgi:hypothetical protein
MTRLAVGAKVLPPDDAPYVPGFCFLEVETLGRVYSFMVRSQEEAQAWVKEIKAVAALCEDSRC